MSSYYDLHLYFYSDGEDILCEKYSQEFDELNDIAIKYNGHWGDTGAAGGFARSINFDFNSDKVIHDVMNFLKEATNTFPTRIRLRDETKKELEKLWKK